MSSESLTLLAILAISIIGHNSSVAWAAGILLALKLLGLSAWFPTIEAHGINYGILLLTMAILVPVANGKITFNIILESFKTPIGIIAILAGIFAAVSGGLGVEFLKNSPEIVSSLIIGTMLGVFFWHGITVGPLIAGGIVYMIYSLGTILTR